MGIQRTSGTGGIAVIDVLLTVGELFLAAVTLDTIGTGDGVANELNLACGQLRSLT